MNILSNEEMKVREKKLLEIYQQSDLKLKVNLQEMIQAKESNSKKYFFKRPSK